MTPGFDLHARYVIHTVGPRYNIKYKTAAENALHSCYRGCLQIAKESRLKTVAFSVINSDKRGYPRDEGAHIALRTIRRFLEHFQEDFERILLCFENQDDWDIYSAFIPLYFPRNDKEWKFSGMILPEDCGNEWGESVIEERLIRVGNLGADSSDEDEDEEVASSWLNNDEGANKAALTVMSPAKDEGIRSKLFDPLLALYTCLSLVLLFFSSLLFSNDT